MSAFSHSYRRHIDPSAGPAGFVAGLHDGHGIGRAGEVRVEFIRADGVFDGCDEAAHAGEPGPCFGDGGVGFADFLPPLSAVSNLEALFTRIVPF